MRPEHSETKAKTETGEWKPKSETKKLLWDRDRKLRYNTETDTSMINSVLIVRESKTYRYALLPDIYNIGYLKYDEINNNKR